MTLTELSDELEMVTTLTLRSGDENVKTGTVLTHAQVRRVQHAVALIFARAIREGRT